METGPHIKVSSDRLVNPVIELETSCLVWRLAYPPHHSGPSRDQVKATFFSSTVEAEFS